MSNGETALVYISKPIVLPKTVKIISMSGKQVLRVCSCFIASALYKYIWAYLLKLTTRMNQKKLQLKNASITGLKIYVWFNHWIEHLYYSKDPVDPTGAIKVSWRCVLYIHRRDQHSLLGSFRFSDWGLSLPSILWLRLEVSTFWHLTKSVTRERDQALLEMGLNLERLQTTLQWHRSFCIGRGFCYEWMDWVQNIVRCLEITYI